MTSATNTAKYTAKNGYRLSSKTPWGNPIVYFFSLSCWSPSA